MGFFNNLTNSAGRQLGSNLVGGQKIQIKSDVKGETKIAEAQAKAQIKQMEAEAKIAEKQNQLEAISSIRFDGSADDIAENINTLFSMYHRQSQGANDVMKGLGLGLGSMGINIKSDSEKMHATIKEKIEFGLLKLRKVDTDMADYFQKKLDDLKSEEKPAKKGFFGRK